MTGFAPLFVPGELLEAVSGRAWLEAMLDVERALANAGCLAGFVPAEAAASISAACDTDGYDIESLARAGRLSGNPAEPLVRELRKRASPEARRYVHFGATSQDVMDTAAMLIARGGVGLVVEDLDRVASFCAALARTHRLTPMVGRTLVQHAVPVTFGLKAAGWLAGILDARQGLCRSCDDRIAAQLGGAAGTMSGFGDGGIRMLELFSLEVDLPAPEIPWHTNRSRIAELGSAFSIVCGVVSKVALDIVLLSQTEVAEVAEGEGGVSSTMPHKQNPASATLARASARLGAANASVLTDSLEQEHERAAGAWQAEWEALSGTIAYTGGAAHALARSLAGLRVDADRMGSNLDLTNGLVMSERMTSFLTDRVGYEAAKRLVEKAAREAGAGRSFRDALIAGTAEQVTADEIDAALDPSLYLGSAGQFVDRVLQRYEAEIEGGDEDQVESDEIEADEVDDGPLEDGEVGDV